MQVNYGSATILGFNILEVYVQRDLNGKVHKKQIDMKGNITMLYCCV